ncbi:MAG: CHAD domain-containing protein [Luteolibacter sp.]
MSFLTDRDAQFAREKLAGGCERIERLLRGLLDTRGRIAEEVHATRKLGKSLRGGFALFGLGKSSSREIQAIGRLLSGPRDAVSRLSTWKKVDWDGDSSAAAAIGALLEKLTHSAARRPPQETIAWCVERVHSARRNLEELPLDSLAEQLAAGLKKLDKQVIKRCRKLNHAGKEDFHDARKALKAYLGALGFLPAGMIPLDPKLTELPELLGDENDLATLSEWLENHGFTAELVPGLWDKLEQRRHQLRSEVIREIPRSYSREMV